MNHNHKMKVEKIKIKVQYEISENKQDEKAETIFKDSFVMKVDKRLSNSAISDVVVIELKSKISAMKNEGITIDNKQHLDIVFTWSHT